MNSDDEDREERQPQKGELIGDGEDSAVHEIIRIRASALLFRQIAPNSSPKSGPSFSGTHLRVKGWNHALRPARCARLEAWEKIKLASPCDRRRDAEPGLRSHQTS